MVRRCLPLLLSSLAAAIFFALPAVAQSAGDAPELFNATEGPSALNSVGMKRMDTLEQDPTTQSIRMVRIVKDLSQQRALTMQVDQDTRVLAPSVSPTFQRNSENEGSSGRMVELSIQRDGINAISEGTYAWTGTVRAGPGKRTVVGDVTLVQGADGNITGTIRVKSEYYLVRPLDDGLHALVEEAESTYSIGNASPRNYGGSSSKSLQSASNAESTVRSPQPLKKSAEKTCHASTEPLLFKRTRFQRLSTKPSKAAPCSQLNTDVLVVYTSDAADGRDIDGIINTAIQEANDSYDDSDIYNAGLTLVHSQQVSISGIGIGGIDDDLGDLQSSGTVQSLRDQHDADVVVLLTADIYGLTKGKVDEIRAEAEDAFTIVAAPTATGGQFVFTHEVGHLQGSQHRPANACAPGTACDEESDLFPDAFANEFEGDSPWWCLWFCDGTDYGTITALPGGYTRVKHFSNPNVSHDGGQTGTGSNNNADAVQATASTVENFRISDDLRASMTVSGTPGDSERTFTAGACGGTGSYSYAWRISYNGPGNYGPPVSSQESFTNTFPEGTHYVKLTVSSGSQSDTAVRSVYVFGGGDCDNPPCPILESTSDSLAAQTATTDEGPMTQTPKRVALRGAAPNPFRSSTEIVYALPQRTDVTLTVYDLMGRKMSTLDTGTRSAGTHQVRLNATALPSGPYVVRLRAGGQQKTGRITVVK
ncbi:zinc-dependent metalloprotease [Salinibacter altiplanensis]|uniref:zinc-dependent metalloprotease n=1 Tax=Salinibacter altiplanensis TaxID=1803181 RepID=UPI00131A57B0|nr:zinc-dependent metalloprotease [Salinibacter altiplanensis]